MPPKSRKAIAAAAAKKRETEEKFQEMSTQNNSMLAQLEEMKSQLREKEEEVARQKALLEESKLREKVAQVLQEGSGLFDQTDSESGHSTDSNDIENLITRSTDLDVNAIDNCVNEPVLRPNSVIETPNVIEPIPDNRPIVDGSDVAGHDLYCINMKSAFKSGIDVNKRLFDHELCEFNVNSWKKHSPQQVLDIINSDKFDKNGEPVGGVKKDFHLYFSNFSKEIFKNLGEIFPYLISPELLGHICANFFAKQNCRSDLNKYLKKYIKDFSGSLFTVPTGIEKKPPPANCTQLLIRKLDLKFVSRSRKLKDANVWPYVNVLDRNSDKIDTAKLRQVKGAPASFDYSVWKSEMEKRFDQEKLELGQRKGKRAADLAIKPKKKRVRRNAKDQEQPKK